MPDAFGRSLQPDCKRQAGGLRPSKEGQDHSAILPPDRGDPHYYELFDENFFGGGRKKCIGAVFSDHSAPQMEIAEAQRAGLQHGWPGSLEVHCLRVRKGKGLLIRLSGHEDDEHIRVGYFYLFHHSLLPDNITDDQRQDSWFDYPATKITIV
jgi:hypothetical protein